MVQSVDIAAINWCIDNGMNVVNMSFGTLAKSQILQDAIERADKAGVLLIAAAGNSGEADGVPLNIQQHIHRFWVSDQ